MKHLVLALALVAGCDSKEKKSSDKIDLQEIKDEAGVDFARKELANIDTALASTDPGRASSSCAVIKVDMPAIKKADAKLHATLEQRCGKDLALRSLTVFVEKAEAARKAAPDDKFLMECSSFDIYMKPVVSAGAEADPQVSALRERHAAACPKK
ncbi:MAG: hypothetical protein M4D80_22730 [Myxococcota bacterium]|nr:hypothetical protein [Myxococcota bacterium]